jgi:acetyl-CoA carboxylase alpha subunit
LIQSVRQLKELSIDEMLDRRYNKYRKMGVFFDALEGGERNGQIGN